LGLLEEKPPAMFIESPMHTGDLIQLSLKSDAQYKFNELEKAFDGRLSTKMCRNRASRLFSEALHLAIESKNDALLQQIVSLFYEKAKLKPKKFTSLLINPMTEGMFKGQTSLYAMMNELYSVSIGSGNIQALLSIQFLVNYLLENKDDDFAKALIATSTVVGEEGKSPLLLLVLSLLSSSKMPFNQPSSSDIATFVDKSVDMFPDTVGCALSEPITTGSFQGKNIDYFLSQVLMYSSKDNSDVTMKILGIFSKQWKMRDDNKLEKAFYTPIELGKYKGMHSLHIILSALISAAYVDNNSEVIEKIGALLLIGFQRNKSAFIEAMTSTITTGENSGVTGLVMLVKAVIAGSNHNLDVNPLLEVLNRLIDCKNPQIDFAMNQKPYGNSYYKDATPSELFMTYWEGVVHNKKSDGMTGIITDKLQKGLTTEDEVTTPETDSTSSGNNEISETLTTTETSSGSTFFNGREERKSSRSRFFNQGSRTKRNKQIHQNPFTSGYTSRGT
jgi:hypothetical protein